MYRQKIVCFLFMVNVLCEALDFNVSRCKKICDDKYDNFREICKKNCLQNYLGKLVSKGNENTLPKPTSPKVVKAGWQTIQLRFNTTELENYTEVEYVVEVKPLWGPDKNGNLFVVYPFTEKYHYTNVTTYTVEELEPNTGYKFRVMALKQNETSKFSNWSNVINTTENCLKLPCGVTNIRLELTSQRPYQRDVNLNATFRWKPSATLSNATFSWSRIEIELKSEEPCQRLPQESKYFTDLDWLTKEEKAYFNTLKDGPQWLLYYDCWYRLETKALDENDSGFATRSQLFHVPECIQINNDRICGCPFITTKYEEKAASINYGLATNISKKITMTLTWNATTWKNSMYWKNLKYFKVELRHQGKQFPKYVNAASNVSQYITTIDNLIPGNVYSILIFAYHDDHCQYAEVKRLKELKAIPACENQNCSEQKPNSTCKRDGHEGDYKCDCDKGFYDNGLGECIDMDPCKTNPCGKNESCSVERPKTGKRNCTCFDNFVRKNGTCVPKMDPCQTNPCGRNEVCLLTPNTGKRNCTCKDNFIREGGTCIPKPENDPSTKDNRGVIAAAVVTPIVVILVAICIIVSLYKRHKVNMDFMQKEMELAVDMKIGSMLSEDNSEKEMNLIYVSQDNVHEIPLYLLMPVLSLELPSNSLQIRSIIGNGEFGKVYLGEAKGVNTTEDWTTVAIKELTEYATEDEFSNFLREIELMKDIGKHENVVQIYGCYTQSRPVCLVLEYAPGGNLLNYLRALKQQCKEAVGVAKQDEEVNSEKKKLHESNAEPEYSKSSFPEKASEHSQLERNSSKQTEELNIEVALKLKEKIRTTLDGKELESFARQIASGMKHVAELRIVHRDLAARNILIGENKVLKIADFGLSREGTYVKNTSGKVPFRWLSIEAIQERTYSTASDVWAFGVVLWEICTLGDVPYSSIQDKDLTSFLLKGNRLQKAGSCTDNLYGIMQKCWSPLPKDRPTFEQLSNALRDLEHNKKRYVNLDTLLEQAIRDEENYGERNENDQDPVDNFEKPLDDNATSEEFKNQGLDHASENKNAEVEQQA